MQAQCILGITMGDPSGIGPEIVVKTLADPAIHRLCRPLVIGDAATLRHAAELCGIAAPIACCRPPFNRPLPAGRIYVLDLRNVDSAKLRKGIVQAASGRAAHAYIVRAVELALTGAIDAVVTSPIHKGALQAGGVAQIGHTEILADLSHTPQVLTMFEVANLRVFFLTRHLSLRRACDQVRRARIVDVIERAFKALQTLGIHDKPLAIAGLNPHCGDNGLFGEEEQQEIIPAVAEARRMGYDVIGPLGADSVFHLARENDWGAVLSLYHDQGHIATKTLDFYRTISLTLGLPFLRTSVDHGTAFDIAGTGKAQAVSLIEAVRKAVHYAPFYGSRRTERENYSS